MFRLFQIAGWLIVFSSALAYSQAEAPRAAVVTFTVDFPTSQPEHYSIRVQSDGPAHYQSRGRPSVDSDSHVTDSPVTDSHDSDPADNDFRGDDSRANDSFDLDFALAAETRQKIFDLAAKAGYFQKDVDFHHKGLAFTGKKTLTYGNAQRRGESTYNYSNNPAVQELTDVMQSLSATLEFGHRLEYDRRYQKLALDEELKRMEDLARTKELVEITAIQSILDQIIADPSVINVSRARAQRLLERAGGH